MLAELEQIVAQSLSNLRAIEAGFRKAKQQPRGRGSKGSPIRVVDPNEMVRRMHEPFGASIVEEVQKRPTYWAYRLLAREVGQELYVRGGTGLMQTVCLEIGDFGALLDKWWIGVGEEGDRWAG